MHAAGAEDGAAQLAELAVGVELFGVLSQRFGAAPTALAFAFLLSRKRRRKGK